MAATDCVLSDATIAGRDHAVFVEGHAHSLARDALARHQQRSRYALHLGRLDGVGGRRLVADAHADLLLLLQQLLLHHLVRVLREDAVAVDLADAPGADRWKERVRRGLVVLEVSAHAADLRQLHLVMLAPAATRRDPAHVLLDNLTRCVLVALDDPRQIVVVVVAALNAIQLALEVRAQAVGLHIISLVQIVDLI